MISTMSRARGLAIVTGAAGGLGSAFARKLATLGYRLLLVDRRQEPLERLCESLVDNCRVSAEPFVADFSRREDTDQLTKLVSQISDLDLLVNNAGFGTLDYFVDTDPELLRSMIDVHVMAPMMLTRAVLPRMLERNSGGIINVSSVSAWFQSAGNAHYGSTKICLAAFTMSLSEELRGTQVRVQALCPGFVRTQFHNTECMKGFSRVAPSARMWATAEKVVDCSLHRLSRGQVVVIPGYGYRVIGRLAQMPLLQPIMRRIARISRSCAREMPTQLQESVPPLSCGPVR